MTHAVYKPNNRNQCTYFNYYDIFLKKEIQFYVPLEGGQLVHEISVETSIMGYYLEINHDSWLLRNYKFYSELKILFPYCLKSIIKAQNCLLLVYFIILHWIIMPRLSIKPTKIHTQHFGSRCTRHKNPKSVSPVLRYLHSVSIVDHTRLSITEKVSSEWKFEIHLKEDVLESMHTRIEFNVHQHPCSQKQRALFRTYNLFRTNRSP